MGLVVMIWKLRLQSNLGLALTIVAVVGLGKYPSAQELLYFQVRESALANRMANNGSADHSILKCFLQREDHNCKWLAAHTDGALNDEYDHAKHFLQPGKFGSRMETFQSFRFEFLMPWMKRHPSQASNVHRQQPGVSGRCFAASGGQG